MTVASEETLEVGIGGLGSRAPPDPSGEIGTAFPLGRLVPGNAGFILRVGVADQSGGLWLFGRTGAKRAADYGKQSDR